MLQAERTLGSVARRLGVLFAVALVSLAALAATACGGSSTTGPSGGGGGGGTGNVTGAISVQNLPCTAGETTPVTCTFTATASGGQGPYSFVWRFTIGGNAATAVTAQGASVSPVFPCGFSAGVATFNVAIEVTITPASGSPQTITSTQQVARGRGACGVA